MIQTHKSVPFNLLNRMKRSQRFKRVAKLTINPFESDDDSSTQTIRRRKSLTVRTKPKPPSIATLNPSTLLDKASILPLEFFQIDALDLAPRLLGKFLRSDDVVLQITEVEAYRPNDSACHGRFGITARTAPVSRRTCLRLSLLWSAYNAKCSCGQGRSWRCCINTACAPVSGIISHINPKKLTGLNTIQQRRGLITDKPVLLTGPGKVSYTNCGRNSCEKFLLTLGV